MRVFLQNLAKVCTQCKTVYLYCRQWWRVLAVCLRQNFFAKFLWSKTGRRVRCSAVSVTIALSSVNVVRLCATVSGYWYIGNAVGLLISVTSLRMAQALNLMGAYTNEMLCFEGFTLWGNSISLDTVSIIHSIIHMLSQVFPCSTP